MSTNFDNKDLFKKGKNNGMGFALFLILIGGVFLLFNTGVIPWEYRRIILSWQMLLIALGLGAILKKNYSQAVILITIGLVFIYPRLSRVFPEYFGKLYLDMHTYWPLLLIFIGICLLVSKFFNRNKYPRNLRGHSSKDSSDFIDKNLMFGSSEQIVLSQNFKGGEVNIMFGEVIVDLRKAQLTEGYNGLEINVLFGSGIVYLPDGWKVEVNGNAFLGSFTDKRQFIKTDYDNNTTLFVRGNSFFGSVEVRN